MYNGIHMKLCSWHSFCFIESEKSLAYSRKPSSVARTNNNGRSVKNLVRGHIKCHFFFLGVLFAELKLCWFLF